MSRRLKTRNVVGHLRRRLAAAGIVAVLSALVAAIGLAALAAVALDAIIVLSLTARVLAPYVIGAVAAAVLIVGVYGLVRLTAVRVARRFERRDPLLGTAVTNAVQLSTRNTTSAVEERAPSETVRRKPKSPSPGGVKEACTLPAPESAAAAPEVCSQR